MAIACTMSLLISEHIDLYCRADMKFAVQLTRAFSKFGVSETEHALNTPPDKELLEPES